MPKDFSVTTLIATNYTKYLDQSINSAICPYVVFDGVEPIKGDYKHSQCNASRPSIARNLALSDINSDFIQILDSDDFLSDVYFEKMQQVISKNNNYDLFYTDYAILNEDFNFTNNEYLKSPSLHSFKEVANKIKNPIIRASTLKRFKFDETLSCLELVDLVFKIGPTKLFHIPHNLQTVRIHSRCHTRILPKHQKDESSKIILGRINAKV